MDVPEAAVPVAGSGHDVNVLPRMTLVRCVPGALENWCREDKQAQGHRRQGDTGVSRRSWKSKLKSTAGDVGAIRTWSMLPSGLRAKVT
jgi:hypothetical protein